MLKRCIVWLNRLLWAGVATVLVLVASYVSIGRYYVKYVELYQDELVQRFNDYYGFGVKLERMAAHWSGLSPVFNIDKLSLLAPDSEDVVLTLDAVSFQIDPISTIIHRVPQVKKLFVNGVLCSLLEASPGRWQLKGFPLAADGTPRDLNGFIDTVLSTGSAELVDARLQMESVGGENTALEIQELSLRRDGDFRRLRLQAQLGKSDHPLSSIVEAQGDPRDQQHFSARAYLKLDDVDFSSHLPAMRVLGIDLREAIVDGEIWADWQPDTQITLQGHASTPYLDVAGLSGEKLAPLEQLSVSFRVEKSLGNDWQAWIPAFQTRWQGETLVFKQLAMKLTDDIAFLAIRSLSVDQAVKHLLAVNLLAKPEQQLIQTLSPAGELIQAHAELSLRHEDDDSRAITQPKFSMRANLVNVSIDPWQGAPGAKGVSGYIEARPLSGMVELDTSNLALDFPHVYHHSLQFESALGQIRWQIDNQTVKVKSGPIVLRGEHGPATGLLSLDLPLHKGEGTPLMDLSIGLRDTEAKYRNLFIPYILNQHFLDWMANSVPSGKVVEGGFIYRGSLLKHAAPDRTVQLFFDIKDTTLNFHQDWPPLTDVRGLVMIDDTSVRVVSDHANMYSLEVNPVVVAVDAIDDGMWLKIDAQAAGAASDALQIVNSSVIDSLVGSAFQSWNLEGTTSSTIDLGIPLSGSKKPKKIAVAVQLANSQLYIPEFRLALSEVNGPLNYRTGSGVSSTGIKASLYGRPLNAIVRQDKQGSVSVDINGRIDMADVAQWSRQPAMAFVSGESDFDASVFVAAKPTSTSKAYKPSEFTVHSQLQGVTIELPSPYGKTPGRAQEFWLRQPLSGDTRQLSMGLKDQAELQIQFDQGELVSGLLQIGDTAGAEHFPGLFAVTGQMDSFSFAQWQPVFDRYRARAGEIARDSEDSPSAMAPASAVVADAADDQGAAARGEQQQAPSGADNKGLTLVVSRLNLGVFEGFSQRIEDCTIDLRQLDDGWWLSAVSPMVEGELFVPLRSGQSISMRLDKLVLPDGALGGREDAAGEQVDGVLSAIDLKTLQPMTAYVAIADLWIGDERYGSLNFELNSKPSMLELNNLGGYIRNIRIGIDKPAHFEWRRNEAGDHSRLYGDFDFSDIGKVLDQWHYERFIESKHGMGSLDLTWAGRPDQWQLKSSQGPLYIKLDEGRFLKASDTASGTLKVVGIVNLMNVVRRLRLDFSDLYEKGISFDRIEGEALLSEGQLLIADNLEVKSPSSRFYLRGSADLKAEELDMEMVVTLPVANNLPWIAALAGGLPTAAGVYVASKIFEDQVDRLSSAMYTIDGDWNDPQMKFKRVFDDTKKLPVNASDKQSKAPATQEMIK